MMSLYHHLIYSFVSSAGDSPGFSLDVIIYMFSPVLLILHTMLYSFEVLCLQWFSKELYICQPWQVSRPSPMCLCTLRSQNKYLIWSAVYTGYLWLPYWKCTVNLSYQIESYTEMCQKRACDSPLFWALTQLQNLMIWSSMPRQMNKILLNSWYNRKYCRPM